MPAYLSCPLCLKSTLSDVQALQTNIASALCRILHCPICSASLQGLPSLHFHLATHIPIQGDVRPGSVPASPEQIPQLEKLEIRDTTDGSNSPTRIVDNGGVSIPSPCSSKEEETPIKSIYNCEFCGLVFSSEHFLTLHKDIMHSDMADFEIECKQCKSRFRNLEGYRDHVKEAHSDRRYICDQCPKSFKIRGGLLVHTRMFHDQSTPCSCQVCKKNFTSKARKEIHERRYHGTGCLSKKQITQNLALHAQKNDLGEAKNCLENLLQKTVHQNSSNVGKDLTVDAVIDTSVNSLNHENFSSKLSPKSQSNSKTQNNQNETIKTAQVLGRQESCPAVIFPGQSETTTQYNHFSIPKETFRTSDVEMNSDSLKNDIEKRQDLQSINYLIEKQQFDSNLTNGSTSQFNFANVPYAIPKYSDLKLGNIGNMFHLSPLVSSPLLYGQSYIPYPNQGGLPILNNCSTAKDPKITKVPTNDTVKMADQFPMDAQNIYSPIQTSHQSQNEVTDPSAVTALSDPVSSLPKSTVKIPKDYTITLPQNVNMNISCLVNTINSPTNLISKVKSAIDQTSIVEDVECMVPNSSQTVNQIVGQDQPSPVTEEFSRTKSTGKKAPFCSKGLESKQWECDECKKSFTTKYFLKKHKRLHTGETPYACEECGKTFTFQQSYHKHVFYHSDDKPHICPHCNRAFKEMSTLHNHVRIHTGEKPFVCTACGKSFRQRVSYLVHQRIHTGILPYSCDVCNRAFRYKVSLRSHKCDGRAAGESSTASLPSRREDDEEQTNLEGLSPKSFVATKRKEGQSGQPLPSKNQEIMPNPALMGLQISPSISCNLRSSDVPGSSVHRSSTLNCMDSYQMQMNSVSLESSGKAEEAEKMASVNDPSNSAQTKDLNEGFTRPLLQNIPLNNVFSHHSKDKILSKCDDTITSFELPPHDNDTCLPMDAKFDHASLTNLNMSGSFSPINLVEDLDNDSFLKSLFG